MDDGEGFVARVVALQQSLEYSVKMTREHVNVPKHSSVKVECCVSTLSLQEDRTLISEPSVSPQWSEVLEFTDILMKLRKHTKPFIIVDVQNPTDHDSTRLKDCYWNSAASLSRLPINNI